MNDLNLCQFIGRIGNLKELKYTASGAAVISLSVACNKSWKDKQGQKQEQVEWVNIVAYRNLAEIISKYCSKGDQIYISGSHSTRKWQDQQGNDRYTTEIIADQMQMLGGKSSANQQNGQGSQGRQEAPKQPTSNSQQGMQNQDWNSYDDDIPFMRITDKLLNCI